MATRTSSRALAAATFAFFAAFLIVGLLVFQDYGLSWDEIPTRQFGLMNVEHRVPDLRTLDSVRTASGPSYERFGPFFENLLVRVEKMVQPMDIRGIFFIRHLLTFLVFFAGVICFHRLCRRRFGPGISLLACICLATTPQLFAHSFYNVKDISFLAMFVATMLTLDMVLERPHWRAMLLHVVATLVLLGARILGGFAMVLTGVSALARRPAWRTFWLLAGYGMAVLALLPLVWPVLRIDFLHIVSDAVIGTTTNPYGRSDLFRGEAIPATLLPWDYVPTWILITTPLVITALFLVGCASSLARIARQPRRYLVSDQRDAIVLAWFFLPVLGCVVLKPIMYDGWRHLYFVYPALVYLAATGMEAIASYVNEMAGESRTRAVPTILTIALFLCLAPSLVFMVRNHPYEQLYFNRFAGRDMQEIKQRFELDYWGLSYRKSLEYIVRSDTGSHILVYTSTYPGRINTAMLRPRDRARITLVRTPEEAEYFVTDYRFHPEPYPFQWEVFAVHVGNASINSVFGSNLLQQRLHAAGTPTVEHRP
ncbi:MAG: hypothetical protein JWM95_3319 [Gemmatimonadetes bacterium]|nr:hypothetical protein [Gemmatimonadota bacterium]